MRFGTFGKTIFRVVGLEPSKVERWVPPAWADAPGREISLEVRSNTVSNPYLAHREEDGGDVDEVLPLRASSTSFGRSAQLVDVVIRDESVSRQHAAVVHSSDGESFLIDMGSAAGTFVDAERVPPQRPIKLSDGMAISFGICRATYTFRVAAQGGKAGKGAKRKR